MLLSIVIVLSSLVSIVVSSTGDRSDVFRDCLSHLDRTVCQNRTKVAELESKHVSSIAKLTKWSCLDECKYRCMWKTVRKFLNYGAPVPQFYGKWPFVRFLGMQEPASALFSFLNGLSLFLMWWKFQKKISRSAPTYYVWSGYALVGINAWFWSTVFHIKDTPLTEKLDYFCATSGVLYSLFGLFARVFWKSSKFYLTAFGVLCVAMFVKHIHYLTFVHFDYGYNMQATITIGLVNSIGWLLWCLREWSVRKYVWKCATVVLTVNILLLLELGDFSPIWWTFDAHSLWHLGTIPLPILWYSFVADDCQNLLVQKKITKYME